MQSLQSPDLERFVTVSDRPEAVSGVSDRFLASSFQRLKQGIRMSYDLNFWKYKSGIYLDARTTYASLCDGENVDGLENLPIEKILSRLKVLFSDGWEQLDELNWEAVNRGAFQISTTSQMFRVDCYGMSGDDMNRFIDLGTEFGCPLYDPQVGTRFDGKG